MKASLAGLLPILAAVLMASAPTVHSDEPAAIAAALAHEAATLGATAARTCVRAELSPPLDSERVFTDIARSVDALAGAAPPPGSGGETGGHDRYAPGPGQAPSRPVDPALAARLNRLLQTALAARPARDDEPQGAVIAAAVPPPLRLGAFSGCDGLAVSAPALVEDIAFVETAYGCGDLCGNGGLLALRWEGGRWTVIAMAPTWVS